jgi:hypothetical protein
MKVIVIHVLLEKTRKRNHKDLAYGAKDYQEARMMEYDFVYSRIIKTKEIKVMKFKLPNKNKPVYEVPVNLPIPFIFKGEIGYATLYVTVTMSSFNFKTNEMVHIDFSPEPKNKEYSNRFNALPKGDKVFLQNVLRKAVEHLVA